jgi:outer membrane receptor protein involved in Fe transport
MAQGTFQAVKKSWRQGKPAGCLLCLGLSLVSEAAQAEEEKKNGFPPNIQDSILDMSIEELLKVKISSVTSKRSSTIAESPGVVSTYTEKDIDKTSRYTIADLARQTPGYTYRIDREGRKVLETRGITARDKHLILVDGIPMNFARGNVTLVENQLPILFAEKVEFLRGPASALYGTGAFLGVVSLTSPQLEKGSSRGKSVVGLARERDEKQIYASYANHYGEGQFDINVGHYQIDGRPDVPPFGSDLIKDQPFTNAMLDSREDNFIYAKHSSHEGLFKGLTFGFLGSASNSGVGFGWANDTYPLSAYTSRSYNYYLKHHYEINDDIRLNSHLSKSEAFDRGTMANDVWKGTNPLYWFGYETVVDKLEGQSELEANTALGILNFGVNFNQMRRPVDENKFLNNFNAPNPPILASTSHTNSVYFQLQKPFDWQGRTTLTLGARYDEGHTMLEGTERHFDQISPRVAVVHQFSEEWSLKFLDGSALKAPDIQEYSHTKEKSDWLIMENYPTLRAEKMRSQEVSMVYHGETLIGALTFFQNKVHDRIDQQLLEPVEKYYKYPLDPARMPGLFSNMPGKMLGRGGEAEATWVTGSYKLSVNYSEADTRIGSGYGDYTPSGKFNFIGIYDGRTTSRYDANVVLHSVEHWIVNTGRHAAGLVQLDAGVARYLTDTTRLALQVENMLDRESYYPSRQGDGLIRNPNRSAMLQIKSNF